MGDLHALGAARADAPAVHRPLGADARRGPDDRPQLVLHRRDLRHPLRRRHRPPLPAARLLLGTSSACTPTASRTRPRPSGGATRSRAWSSAASPPSCSSGSPTCCCARARGAGGSTRGSAAIPLLAVVLFITPIWIEPLFNKFGPMKDKVLESQILALADRAGIEGSRVYEVNKSVDTKTVNAYVTGFLEHQADRPLGHHPGQARLAPAAVRHGSRDGPLRARPRLAAHPAGLRGRPLRRLGDLPVRPAS